MPSINILSKDNGAGTSRSTRLLEEILGDAGFSTCRTTISEKDLRRAAVCAGQNAASLTKRLKCRARRWLARRKMERTRFDINLFLESVLPDWFPAARFNCLIPNPEWFEPWWRQYLPRFDMVLCKTRHAEKAFRDCGPRVEYVSFTSFDRFQADVRCDDRSALHVAGSSLQKGTRPLLELWRRHPEWPNLTVVQRRESNPPIRRRQYRIQNRLPRRRRIAAAAKSPRDSSLHFRNRRLWALSRRGAELPRDHDHHRCSADERNHLPRSRTIGAIRFHESTTNRHQLLRRSACIGRANRNRDPARPRQANGDGASRPRLVRNEPPILRLAHRAIVERSHRRQAASRLR